MAGSVYSTGHIATNCRNVCSVSLMSAHGTHSAYSRTPVGATDHYIVASGDLSKNFTRKLIFLVANATVLVAVWSPDEGE